MEFIRDKVPLFGTLGIASCYGFNNLFAGKRLRALAVRVFGRDHRGPYIVRNPGHDVSRSRIDIAERPKVPACKSSIECRKREIRAPLQMLPISKSSQRGEKAAFSGSASFQDNIARNSRTKAMQPLGQPSVASQAEAVPTGRFGGMRCSI